MMVPVVTKSVAEVDLALGCTIVVREGVLIAKMMVQQDSGNAVAAGLLHLLGLRRHQGPRASIARQRMTLR